MKILVEFIIVGTILFIAFGWILHIFKPRKLKGIIYFEDGTTEESNIIFNNFNEYEDWVQYSFRKYADKIYKVDYKVLKEEESL